MYIKENPPIADASAKGGALVLKTLNIAGERIPLHLLEGNAKAFPLLLGARATDFCACRATRTRQAGVEELIDGVGVSTFHLGATFGNYSELERSRRVNPQVA